MVISCAADFLFLLEKSKDNSVPQYSCVGEEGRSSTEKDFPSKRVTRAETRSLRTPDKLSTSVDESCSSETKIEKTASASTYVITKQGRIDLGK